MKWFSIFAICALAFLSNACEKHAVSELPAEDREGTPYASEPKHGAAAEGEKHEAAPAEAGQHEAAGGEAPKFFPEKK